MKHVKLSFIYKVVTFTVCLYFAFSGATSPISEGIYNILGT